MNSTTENIAFIVVRGIIALAMVGLGFFCIAKGIHFFVLPRVEAEQIHIHIVGLDITANGLGAVIFGTGLGFCFIGKRTAPTRIQTTRTSETLAASGDVARPDASAVKTGTPHSNSLPNAESVPISVIPATVSPSNSVRTTEGVTIMEGPSTPSTRFD
jgi:hypothetical protein